MDDNALPCPTDPVGPTGMCGAAVVCTVDGGTR